MKEQIINKTSSFYTCNTLSYKRISVTSGPEKCCESMPSLKQVNNHKHSLTLILELALTAY